MELNAILVLGTVIFFFIIVTMFYSPSSINTPAVSTTEQTRKELCIIQNELKYPTAENYTINRLCYLEELGRSLSE